MDNRITLKTQSSILSLILFLFVVTSLQAQGNHKDSISSGAIKALQLRMPTNMKDSVEYDADSEEYIIHKKVGSFDLGVPEGMTPAEYNDYVMSKSLQEYWNKRNQKNDGEVTNNWFLNNLNNSPFGSISGIFEGMGVSATAQGSAELQFGITNSKIDNPTIPERMRSTTSFDFQNKIQTNITGSVGDYITLGLNYNSEATFDFDNKTLLRYEGDEDDILQTLELGNVSLPLQSTLIQGSQSLFGLKTTLKFGRLTASAVISQQKTEAQTVKMNGGAQKTEFEMKADQYDYDQHFFLSQYFRDKYENSMSLLPYINSGIKITRVEVWLTNKEANFTQSRNIVGFVDLGEPEKIYNPFWTPNRGVQELDNKANNLYEDITKNYSGIRDVNKVTSTLASIPQIVNGVDYERLTSARMLSPSEYILNPSLGYITLLRTLSSDQVLSVAYEYVYRGKTYHVGELTSGGVAAPNTLVTKLIRATSQSPNMPCWDLMMKNIYYIGSTGLDASNFQLNIQYKDDSTGANFMSLNVGNISGKTLLSVMELDNIDYLNNRNPDGFFDYVEGYTINSQYGKIIFPVLEPFGSHLKKEIGGDPDGDKYIYQSLYDSTLVKAQSQTSKNKFLLSGYYKSTSGSEIILSAVNIPQGSVKVTAGGVPLQENVDYTVDYNLGRVRIINQSLIESGTPIQIDLENQSLFNLQKKTMMGTHLEYELNKNLSFGGTLMHMYERPFTQKVNIGEEPIANTILGLNASYLGESQAITEWLNSIPALNLKGKSSISANAEIAELIPGHSNVIGASGTSYIDDFEATKTNIDLHNYIPWNISSVPEGQSDLFPEASFVNDLNYGKNRARLAWYYIDPIFTRVLPGTPKDIANDADKRSEPYTREVLSKEVWPNKQLTYGSPIAVTTLNLAYYPEERGPYNYDARPTAFSKGIDLNGKLVDPSSRWAGISRSVETSDFEMNNIEYVEFWVMDPFINNKTSSGGELYFNLGNISEDVLKDGYKFFENGMPTDGSLDNCDTTVWGVVPRRQGLVNAFDNESKSRLNQDVGLNGLNDTREYSFFSSYLNDLQTYVPNYYFSSEAQTDVNSPVNDPSGDNFHYYRGTDYDQNQVSILERYKYYNNPQGNSLDAGQSGENYSTAATTIPNSEDINRDNTLSEDESYYQYKIDVKPSQMIVGKNNIVDKQVSDVTLANGQQTSVTWYQFRIPIQSPDKVVGRISDLKSIRFMRIFMRGFKDETVLRFASLDLVRSDWRPYNNDLFPINTTPISTANFDLAAVNIEENSDKTPVNYVLPPGVNRTLDPTQPQEVLQNEQSLSMKVDNLAPQDARGAYKNIGIDLRRYKRIQLYWHAEALEGEQLEDNQLTAFIRLGTDNEENYYEYELPLKVTSPGRYNSELDREKVWPIENYMDIPFSKFTNLKLQRNSAKNIAGTDVSYTKVYTSIDPENPANRVTVVGSPSIGQVKTVMIGVRNRSGIIRSAEVWADELRVAEFDESGGWAGTANTSIRVADLGSVNVSGTFQTAGFGSIDQSMMERSQENTSQYNISTNLELGKLLPEKIKLQIPMYYSFSEFVTTPKYDPFNSDLTLDQTLSTVSTKSAKDSIKSLVEIRETRNSLNFSNVKFDISSKNPMPYDPTNFSVNYSYTEVRSSDPTVESAKEKTFNGSLNYDYAPQVKPLEPFANTKSKVLGQPAFQIVKDFNFSYLPQSISYHMLMSRYYFENQFRDFNGFRMDPQVRRQFYLDRLFNLQYNPFKSLQMTFSSTTNSIIDEPFEINGKNYIINKNLYPTEYEIWKDSVRMNIRHLGRTSQYNQTFTAAYSVPFDKIPYLDFISANANYASVFSWFTAPQLGEDSEDSGVNPGNTISNLNAIQLDGKLAMGTFYDKFKYLKDINSQYRGKKTTRGSDEAYTTGSTKEVRYEENVTLEPNKKITINHNLGTKEIRARGYDDRNRAFAVKIEPVDENTSKISYSRNVEDARIILIGEVDAKKSPLEEAAKVMLRMMMGVKDISVSYQENNSTTLYGFLPGVGLLGQDASLNAPGYGFAFGLQDKSFGRDAEKNGWLTDSLSSTSPYSMTHVTNLNIRANIDPLPDLKVELNAGRMTSNVYSEYLQPSSPYYNTPFEMGNITTTFNAIGSSFWNVSTSGDFNSKTFDKFLENRIEISQRMAQQKELEGIKYPTTGDFVGQPYAGNPYHANILPDGTIDPTGTSGINQNSPDVMIPAFLAAYTGKSASEQSLGIIPTLSSMMPNWRISYSGLSNFAFFKKYFNAITLSHAYQSTYNMGSYSTNPSYNDYEGGFDLSTDVSGNSNAGFASQYDVPSVSITEAFNPLFGVDLKMRNKFTFKTSISRARNITLNIPSNQLIEGYNNQKTFGFGYRIDNFNLIIGNGSGATKVRNDLTLKFDLSWNDMKTFIRRIDEIYSEPSSGVKTTSYNFSADYTLTRNINVRLYFDQVLNNQLISTFYNTANTSFGVSFRFNLAVQ